MLSRLIGHGFAVTPRVRFMESDMPSGLIDIGAPPYNALGNGTTNESAVLQQAINDAMETAGTVWLRPGRNYIAGGLSGNAPFGIMGGGWGARLTLPSGSTSPVLTVQNLAGEIEGFWASNFTVDGNHGGQVDAGLIQINNVTGFVVDRLRIQNAGTANGSSNVNGIAVSAGNVGATASQGTIRDCLIQDCTKAGINWTTEAINGYIVGNRVRRCDGQGQAPGAQINGGFNGLIFGNAFYENEGCGLLIASAGTTPATDPKNAQIVGNYCYSNGQGTAAGDGIRIANAYSGVFGHIKVVGNYCYSNGVNVSANGINAENQFDVDLEGNHCYSNKLSGILVNGCTEVRVLHNHCKNNDQASVGGVGIMLIDVTNFRVTHNRCYDDQGTKTQGYGLSFFTGTACDVGRVTENDFGGNGTGYIQTVVSPTNTVIDSVSSTGS